MYLNNTIFNMNIMLRNIQYATFVITQQTCQSNVCFPQWNNKSTLSTLKKQYEAKTRSNKSSNFICFVTVGKEINNVQICPSQSYNGKEIKFQYPLLIVNNNKALFTLIKIVHIFRSNALQHLVRLSDLTKQKIPSEKEPEV